MLSKIIGVGFVIMFIINIITYFEWSVHAFFAPIDGADHLARALGYWVGGAVLLDLVPDKAEGG